MSQKNNIRTLTPQVNEEKIIGALKNKESNFYFYVANSKGIPSAGVAYVYDLVDILREKGYKAHILHDSEYLMPKWMEGNYDKLPHQPFPKLEVTASDFLFIPEFVVQSFFSDMDKNNIKLPCEVVVLSQVYDLIYHSLDIGAHWYHFGVRSVITTSEKQKDFIDNSMRSLKTHVINPYIHDDFSKSDKPQKPFILVYTRSKEEGEKIAKIFYQKFPQYRWIPFKFLSNSDRSKFAIDMKECCVAIWLDDISSFGTFPLECMKSGVPVIGKIPQMMPEWMGEENDGAYKIKNNGLWVLSLLNIPEFIAKYMDEWLTDTLDTQVYDDMLQTVSKYTKAHSTIQTVEVFENLINDRIERVKMIFDKQNKVKKTVTNV